MSGVRCWAAARAILEGSIAEAAVAGGGAGLRGGRGICLRWDGEYAAGQQERTQRRTDDAEC